MKKAKAKAKRPTVLKRVTRWLKRALSDGDDWWRSAGGVVVNEKNKVALIRQGKTWTLPKGRVDPGEGLTAAARREVYEESGLRVLIVDYLCVINGERHETHYFLMKLQADDGVHDDEVDEVKFAGREKAARLLRSSADRRVLRHAFAAIRRL